MIPAKHGRPTTKPASGHYRRQMQVRFNRDAYRQRAQVETVMSMIKRRQGGHVRGRSYHSQHPDFFTVFPRATEEQKRHFELLRKAYIDARYKRDYKITKQELEYLATRVRKLQRLTKKICREKIASLVK